MLNGLNREEKLQYERDGYVILKNIIPKSECKSLMKKSIKPILRKNNLYYKNKRNRINKTGGFFLGKSGQPIRGKNRKWPALFQNPRLLLSICDMHPHYSWKWVDGAVTGLGWIHMRFPYSRSKTWKPPKTGWHLDGLKNNMIDYKKSVTVLPLITSITKNGGGTALFKGSHKLINYWIHNLQNRISLSDYIDKHVNSELDKYSGDESSDKSGDESRKTTLVEAQGEEGDILIMHPHLIHATSNCGKNNKLRITFNLSTNYC